MNAIAARWPEGYFRMQACKKLLPAGQEEKYAFRPDRKNCTLALRQRMPEGK